MSPRAAGRQELPLRAPPASGAGSLLAPRKRDTPLPATLRAANLTVPRSSLPSEAAGSRSSSRLDETPLPVPLPYHVADPTTRSLKKLSEVDLLVPTPDPDDGPDAGPDADYDDASDGLPVVEDAKTRPGDDDSKRLRRADGSGLSNAARRISEALIKPPSQRGHDDLSLELDTRQRPRIETGELEKIARPPPTVPVERLDLLAALDDLDDLDLGDDDDDAKTAPPSITRNMRAERSAGGGGGGGEGGGHGGGGDGDGGDDDHDHDHDDANDDDSDDDDDGSVPTLTDEEQDEPTRPRDAPLDLLIRTENEGAFGSAFFQPLPAEHRRAVLARFLEKSVKKGTTVIRQGEVGHSLVVVLKGQLVARVDRKGGPVELGAVGTGEFVGEGSLLARGPSQVHVSALTDCELLLLVPRDFYEIAGAFPALWAELKDVAERRKRELESLTKRSAAP